MSVISNVDQLMITRAGNDLLQTGLHNRYRTGIQHVDVTLIDATAHLMMTGVRKTRTVANST